MKPKPDGAVTDNWFNCHVTFVKNWRSRHSMAWLRQNFKDIGEHENAHAPFDCQDINGNIADVYLFQVDGNLMVRGARGTRVLRDPQDVTCFQSRSKRVKKITLVYRDDRYENLPKTTNA